MVSAVASTSARDGRDASPVLAPDRDGRSPEAQIGDLVKKDHGASGRAEPVCLQIGDRIAFMLRQAHVDTELLPAPLHPLCLLAEERGPDLARELVHREAQRPGLGFRVDLNLADAPVHVRPHIDDSRRRPKESREGVRDGR